MAQTGVFEGYTVTQLEKLIMWELGNVTGTTISYDRFPKWLVRQKLIERQNDFALKSRCLKKFALVRAKANYRNYKLPTNCMDNGVIAVRYYDSSTTYEDLKIVDQEWLDTNRAGWLTEDAGDPEYCLIGDNYGNIPMIYVHPMPDADGTDYTISPDTGICIGGDLPGTTSNVTGAASGGSDTTLEDSTVDFTDMGLVAGMAVLNVTDGSKAYISTLATTTITFAAALTGGTLNVFTAGDSYNILAGEYGVITSWEDDEQYIFSSEEGAVAQITVPAGNFRVDYVPYPTPFAWDDTATDAAQGNDDQKPEIHRKYHYSLVKGVIADLLRTFHEASKEFQRAQVYENSYQMDLAEAAAKKYGHPFEDNPVSFYPRRRHR